MRRAATLSLAVLLTVVVAAPALATTTVRSINGVEIISSERDVAPVKAKAHAGARTTSSSVREASAAATRLAAPALSPPLRGASQLIATAMSFLGTPYVWGGAAPGGFDCSGFTYYAFSRLGIAIPRTADVQFAYGRPVAGDPLPGDLVFFQTYDYGASHVGIYLGNGQFVNSIGTNVHVTSFGSTYFRERYLGARRFLPS